MTFIKPGDWLHIRQIKCILLPKALCIIEFWATTHPTPCQYEQNQLHNCVHIAWNLQALHCPRTNHMMTSSNGNIFRVTGPLCGEFTDHRCIPLREASDAELWCFLWSVDLFGIVTQIFFRDAFPKATSNRQLLALVYPMATWRQQTTFYRRWLSCVVSPENWRCRSFLWKARYTLIINFW